MVLITFLECKRNHATADSSLKRQRVLKTKRVVIFMAVSKYFVHLVLFITSNMSKIIRAMLLSAYSALLFHLYLHSFNSQEDGLELKYFVRTPGTLKKIHRDIKKNKSKLPMMFLNFTKSTRLPTDFKYILKWTQAYSHYNSAIFKNGQKAFLDHNCTQYNCFLTNDKSLLLDLRYYDAILFDVENNWEDHPPVRAPHQRYIFTASESAGNYPICDDYFENYYNLTWTYKLNSDIPWTYITIVDKNNIVIGPKVNLTWVEHMDPTPDFVKKKLLKKKKAVAWFVSNCYSKARQKVANDIAVSLSKYNLKLDVYGWCGNKTCPRDRIEDCLDLLQKDYFFYLAFEKSMAEDYVTEKILYPLLHYTVPIVYGGADYSRFLPPSSYIDAGKLNSDEIATLIVEAINNRNVYEDYFRWHNHYTYKESPVIADVCSLCELLHSQENEFKSINKFRQWWNPSYKELCKNEHHFVDIKNK